MLMNAPLTCYLFQTPCSQFDVIPLPAESFQTDTVEMKILSAYGDLPGLNFVEFLGKKQAEAKSFFFKLCLRSLKKIGNVRKKHDNGKKVTPNCVLRETFHASDKF